MSVLSFLTRNLSSLSRNQHKKQVLNQVLNSPQSNNDVINVHRIDENNVGDFYCAPHLYFDSLKNKKLDIFDFKAKDESIRNDWIQKISANSLIIGGGGLLNRSSFEMQMKLFEALANKGKKMVIWGIGHNEKDKKRFGKINTYNIDLSKFGLIGTRDYTMNNSWLPCVSCKHEIFDKNFEISNEVGIIFHKKTIKDQKLLKTLSAYPSTSNTKNLEDMVGFIGQTDTLVTDSYHAMYWAMLLGKKVIAIPNSSKFFDFKYQPVFSSFSNFTNDLSKAKRYDGVLEECRSINDQFAEKAFNYLNI